MKCPASRLTGDGYLRPLLTWIIVLCFFMLSQGVSTQEEQSLLDQLRNEIETSGIEVEVN